MGKIFYLMGKSSSGKDTIYKKLIQDPELKLKTIVLYTTRPIRAGEQEGMEYHFVTEEVMDDFNISDEMMNEEFVEGETGGSGSIFLIIGIVVIVLALAGVAAFIIIKKKKKKDSDDFLDLDEGESDDNELS